MVYNHERALELLRLGTQKQSATFHDDQEDAIYYVVKGLGRLLVVQRTGWGKSSVYFIATRLLRESGAGPALLISPLLALMRNQIAAAERMGVRAWTINSENQDDWDSIEDKLAHDEVDILLISPERLANEHFRNEVLAPVSGRISLIVVDEAHCISDWGHDFRPSYRFIERIVRTLPQNVRLLATTATANNRVMQDLQTVLGPNLMVSKGDLSRPSLFLQTLRMPNRAERMAWLANHIPTLPGSGIIYTLTVRDTSQVAKWLCSKGIVAEAYSAEIGDRRVELENALLENKIKVLVATTALGMGFDKPDLAFVIHYQTPGSVVAYYQQVGRAGRALPAAHGVLLSGEEDTEITDYFIDNAFPSREEVEQVMSALKTAPGGLSIAELMMQVNAKKGRIDKALDLLSLESPPPIVKEKTKWMLTTVELSETFWTRAERLTALRRSEQEEMQKYVHLPDGHMEFLLRALDCNSGVFHPPAVAPLPTTMDAGLVRDANTFLRRTNLPLELRKKWPNGGLPLMKVKGLIPAEHQSLAGRILCVYGDAGWGPLVRQGKYRDGRFSDELVAVCAALVREWAPQPPPEWVTCIPSLRHPDLVPDFAGRLAVALNLPFNPVLVKTDNRRPQKEMQNSSQQARNIDGSLAVTGSVPTGPVLLVDDMVDSKWTLTVAAFLLKSHGSGDVFPLALASTSNAE